MGIDEVHFQERRGDLGMAATRIEHRGVVWVRVAADGKESIFSSEAEAKAAGKPDAETPKPDAEAFAEKMKAAKAAKAAAKNGASK